MYGQRGVERASSRFSGREGPTSEFEWEGVVGILVVKKEAQ
jgi:hypothetical protein